MLKYHSSKARGSSLCAGLSAIIKPLCHSLKGRATAPYTVFSDVENPVLLPGSAFGANLIEMANTPRRVPRALSHQFQKPNMDFCQADLNTTWLAVSRKIANLCGIVTKAIFGELIPLSYFMRSLVTLFAILVSLTGTAALAQQSPLALNVPSASGSFLAGQQALRDLQTDQASRYFLDATEAGWDNPVIVERAFTALAIDGRIDDAAAIAQHLIEIESENELARLVLGTVALKERRYRSAVTNLESVGAASFIGITATILHGWSLLGDGDYPASQVLLDELGEAGLEEFLVFHRALMADVAGERESALSYADLAYQSDPYVARIVEAYARILGNAAQFDEARAVLDAYEQEGLSHPIVTIVAEAVARDTRPGKLASSVQVGAGEMFHGIGAALSRDGSVDLGVMFLQLGRYLDPDSDVIVMALGQLYESAERYEMANAIYEALPITSPMKSAATVRIAENLNEMGDREEAIRRLGNIVAVQPENLDAVSVLGDLYRYDERYQESIKAYSKAINIVGGDRPRDWRFFYVRGIAYERAKEWPSAEADFLKALELNPGQPQVLNYLGYSWVDQNMNLERALEMIKQAVNSNPNDGYIVDSLGWAYYRMGRIDEAVRTLEQAVQLRPNDPEINDHLGDAYWAAGRKLEARFQWNIVTFIDSSEEVKERARIKLVDGLDAPTE